jgi:hypothetical protein
MSKNELYIQKFRKLYDKMEKHLEKAGKLLPDDIQSELFNEMQISTFETVQDIPTLTDNQTIQVPNAINVTTQTEPQTEIKTLIFNPSEAPYQCS